MSITRTYSKSADLLTDLKARLASLYRPYEGAHFRVVFDCKNGAKFTAGCVFFRAHHVPSRPMQNYGNLILAEEWVMGQSDAMLRLEALCEGDGAVENLKIPHKFNGGYGGRHTYAIAHGWSGWQYTVPRFRTASDEEVFLAQDALLAFDLRPYEGAAGAISEWVFETKFQSPASNKTLNHDCFMIWLPDTRGRVTSAEWVPNILRMDFELTVPEADLQLQLLYAGSAKSYEIVPFANPLEVQVPEGTTQINAYLIFHTGECLAHLNLYAPYDTFGLASQRKNPLREIVEELRGGENERVEYKPFIKPMDQKEQEFIKTVVAFANTSGGRIYVGVMDNGSPEGDQRARQLFRAELDQALKGQVDRLRAQVRNSTKPVPNVDFSIEEALGASVVVAQVARGANVPYATHDNRVFIRKGATNRMADPKTELPFLRPKTIPEF